MIEMRPHNSFLRKGFIDYCNFLKKEKVKSILEIGSYGGESIELIKQIVGDDVLVVSIDPWQVMYDENDLISDVSLDDAESSYNEKTKNFSYYVKCKMRSQDIEHLFKDEFFDCLYVDGLHTYEQVCLDLSLYVSKVKRGGIISGHDYLIPYTDEQYQEIIDFNKNHKLRTAVSDAVNEIVGTPDILFGDSSWVKIKI